MGSAEFEFGAFPKALQTIVRNGENYSCWTLEVSGKDIKAGKWRKWGRKPNPLPPVPESVTVFVIGPTAKREEVEALIKEVGNGEADLKDDARFAFDPSPVEYSRKTVGWLDIRNAVAWFRGAKTRDRFSWLLGIEAGTDKANEKD
jgi:hypothetical protein